MELPPLVMLELFARILVAAALGGLVGLEREYIARPAGLRTHMLVSVGAALVFWEPAPSSRRAQQSKA